MGEGTSIWIYFQSALPFVGSQLLIKGIYQTLEKKICRISNQKHCLSWYSILVWHMAPILKQINYIYYAFFLQITRQKGGVQTTVDLRKETGGLMRMLETAQCFMPCIHFFKDQHVVHIENKSNLCCLPEMVVSPPLGRSRFCFGLENPMVFF